MNSTLWILLLLLNTSTNDCRYQVKEEEGKRGQYLSLEDSMQDIVTDSLVFAGILGNLNSWYYEDCRLFVCAYNFKEPSGSSFPLMFSVSEYQVQVETGKFEKRNVYIPRELNGYQGKAYIEIRQDSLLYFERGVILKSIKLSEADELDMQIFIQNL